MTRDVVLNFHWLPEGEMDRWKTLLPEVAFVDAREGNAAARFWPDAVACYGLPDLQMLRGATKLRWIQLGSAGVPAALCPIAKEQGIRVTNLAGLYGPTIAEHALAMLLYLSRNLNTVAANQTRGTWDRGVAGGMRDLRGKTLAIVGLGNIGQNIARLAQAFGMRVIGCRRRPIPAEGANLICPPSQVTEMLREADHLAVAAPLLLSTDGMLGAEEFAALKPAGIYINVSRGPVAQESALLEALRSGHLAGAGLDVFAVEPLPADHAFWSMPNVLVSPHYSGETVNNSSLPAERFMRNLQAWKNGAALEGVVDLEQGY